MSVETLLTLGVAAGILVLAMVLRLVVLGSIRLVRVVSGRPARRAQRPIEEAVAPRGSFGERGKQVLDGVVALLTFVVATLASVLRRVGVEIGASCLWVWERGVSWWRRKAQPSLHEAREAGLALMTEKPEASGRVEVLERTTPVLHSNGSMAVRERDESADMQLV